MNQSSITFQVWKEEFEKNYLSIFNFIDDFDGECFNPMKAKLIENLDVISHDSYGYEDSALGRIFYFPDYDIYIKFSGERESYKGEEWTDMKEVKLTKKTIQVYE